MFIDTHCHITFKEFDDDRITILSNAKKAGVKKFIIPGTDYASSLAAQAFASQHADCVYHSVGVHPYEASDGVTGSKLSSLISPTTIAIGECGLDYHLYKGFPAVGKKDEQKRLFETQLLLALERNLPVIIHCRDAYEEIFSVLDGLPSLPTGVFHCFSGGLSDFREVSARGFFVGFDGNITFSKQLQSIIPSIPLSSILLETDAPYLTPLPHRGTRNEPKYIPLIAKTLASLQSVDDTIVRDQTTKNAKNLFSV